MDNDRSYRRYRSYRGSLFGPVVLILLGIVFLFYNLGLMTGDIWDTVLRLWPVLLIVMGLDGILRQEGLVGAVVLIGLGSVFLLSNFGFLALNIWQTILRLWPIVLIAIGFDVVIGRRSIWASLAGMVLILALLFGALSLFGVREDRGAALAGQQVSQALEGASQARVVINPGVAAVRVTSLDDPQQLVSGRVAAGRGQQVRQDYSISGDQATYTLQESGGAPFFIPGERGRWEWDLGLNPEVPIDLELGLGAGEADLELSDLNLSGLKVDMGVGQVTITLPGEGRFQAEINGAIGQMVVIVPQGVAVRAQTDTGIAAVEVPDDYQRQEDTYTSPDYASAENRVDLELSQAIGQVVIRDQ